LGWPKARISGLRSIWYQKVSNGSPPYSFIHGVMHTSAATPVNPNFAQSIRNFTSMSPLPRLQRSTEKEHKRHTDVHKNRTFYPIMSAVIKTGSEFIPSSPFFVMSFWGRLKDCGLDAECRWRWRRPNLSPHWISSRAGICSVFCEILWFWPILYSVFCLLYFGKNSVFYTPTKWHLSN
jgi:hypothetical protein